MMTVKEMHAGDGYAYLMRGVADSAGMAGGAMSQVTAYYAAEGNPPGVWLGSGLGGLDHGRGLEAGSTVTGDQMEALFRNGEDPITGDVLGRRNRVAAPLRDRVAARVAELDAALSDTDRAAAIADIERHETAVTPARSVAGFDFTFTTPKSVSALWALADAGVREQLYEAHRAAVADVVATFERDFARTRIGVNGAAQVGTRGVIAAAFDHWDNRNGDPHLHTHVVIANRVQAADGRWRTLDSLGSVFPNVVALSELYNNVLASQITGRLGIEWAPKSTGRGKVLWELDRVPAELMEEFSTRRAEIVQAREQLDATNGVVTSQTASRRRDAQAWRQTRVAKQIVSLRDHLVGWRQRAGEVLGRDPSKWAARLTRRAARRRDWGRVPLMRADDLSASTEFEELAEQALMELASSRSTWTTANIRAAVSRATMQVRFASTADIVSAVDQLTARVEEMSIDLTPPETLHTPAHYRRHDGSSSFRRHRIFSASMVLDAEARLVSAGRRMDGPRLELDAVAAIVATPDAEGRMLADDQAASVAQIAVSGRRVDVLVGPAGTGKTTTLAKLTAAWQATHGEGSVIGLAPSAAAAQVLGESLGIPTDNTAKWLFEQPKQAERVERITTLRERAPRSEWIAKYEAEFFRWTMPPGSLVIVDEASLAGTLALDKLRDQAEASGAKLLLVGDPYQLSAVEAGGAFGLLVADREGTAPELSGVWRFRADWERGASIQLRLGEASVLDTYAAHGRLHDHAGDATDAAYQAWRADEADDLVSLLIAADNTTVVDLNRRAREDRVRAGLVTPDGVELHDHTMAGTGDRIVTRRNKRRLTTGKGWVKNGDTWDVVKAHRDGSLLVRRRSGGATITLPASYVADHVELAYATTAHRTQGATVDTAHLVVNADTPMSREVLYVAMTRGRASNHAHVNTTSGQSEHQHLDEAPRTARTVLADVLSNADSAVSATERRTREAVADVALVKVAAEYETIRRWATRDRYADALRDALPDTPAHQLPQWPTLTRALRRLESAGTSPVEALRDAAASLPAEFSPDDLAQALRSAAQAVPAPAKQTIVGLFPADTTTTDPDLRRALDERAALITHHGQQLVTAALHARAPWLRHLGPRPTDPDDLRAWVDHATTVAVYRELHHITGDDPLGDTPTSWEQHAQWQQAQRATDALAPSL